MSTTTASLTLLDLYRQPESGGNTRGMPGERNWANMSTKELQEAAKDNHDRPLGTFMGDYQVKGKEGPEEAVSRSFLYRFG